MIDNPDGEIFVFRPPKFGKGSDVLGLIDIGPIAGGDPDRISALTANHDVRDISMHKVNVNDSLLYIESRNVGRKTYMIFLVNGTLYGIAKYHWHHLRRMEDQIKWQSRYEKIFAKSAT